MSSITGLISGGGGGTPVNSIARLAVNGQTQYTDEAGGVWLKTGNTISADAETYPNASQTATITVTATSSFSVASQDAGPTAVEFNNDGTKMYVAGFFSDSVYQYSLSTAFDVTTASYDSVSFSVTSQDGTPTSLRFNDNGSKMYVSGTNTDTVYEYSLSTPFDLSTASYNSASFSLASQEPTPVGLDFNNDGTKMYVVGDVNNTVFQYSLSTAYDISTASYDNVSFALGDLSTNTTDIKFNNDGTFMFILRREPTDLIFMFPLSTAYDISTANNSSYAFYGIGALEGQPYGLTINNNNDKLYVTGTSSDNVNEIEGFFGGTIGLSTDTGTYDYVKLK